MNIEAIQNRKDFDSIFSHLHSLYENKTLKGIKSIHFIGLDLTCFNEQQFQGAFHEFLRNTNLCINFDTCHIDFSLDFVGLNYRNMPEFDNRIMELDDDLIRIDNDYWTLWLRFIDNNKDYAHLHLLLDWEFDYYGYWTDPGVLIHRCLGQSLTVLTM